MQLSESLLNALPAPALVCSLDDGHPLFANQAALDQGLERFSLSLSLCKDLRSRRGMAGVTLEFEGPKGPGTALACL